MKAIAIVLTGAALALFTIRPAASQAAPPAAPAASQPVAKPPQSNKRLLIGAGVVLIAALAGGVAWYELRPGSPVPIETASATAPAPASPTEPVPPNPRPGAASEAADAAHLGSLRIDVRPWGVVSVDGANKGVSPPLKRLSLPEGKHTVEITNQGFAAYSTEIQIQKDHPATVRHQFK